MKRVPQKEKKTRRERNIARHVNRILWLLYTYEYCMDSRNYAAEKIDK